MAWILLCFWIYLHTEPQVGGGGSISSLLSSIEDSIFLKSIYFLFVCLIFEDSQVCSRHGKNSSRFSYSHLSEVDMVTRSSVMWGIFLGLQQLQQKQQQQQLRSKYLYIQSGWNMLNEMTLSTQQSCDSYLLHKLNPTM